MFAKVKKTIFTKKIKENTHIKRNKKKQKIHNSKHINKNTM